MQIEDLIYNKVYNKEFFESEAESSIKSARGIVPYIIEAIHPSSVIDVGCGIGAWLREFQLEDMLGVEGTWVNDKKLLVPKEKLVNHDLNKPLRLPRRYDIALCLEVGEHLPESSSKNLVKTLTDASNIVVFSAAIPHQGGNHHVNEQFPEYWCAFFRERGYVPVDYLREKIWYNMDVNFWYSQNTVFYVKKSVIADYPKLNAKYLQNPNPPLNIIHPSMYLLNSDPKRIRMRQIVKGIPYATVGMCKFFLKKIENRIKHG